MRICVITDNEFIFNNFLILSYNFNYQFDFFYSSFNEAFSKRYEYEPRFKPILLKNEDDVFFRKYELFMSLHSKQIFPQYLVKKYRCVNVHPGINPYNRGWFPQVFSIINKHPVGVTIHEMDSELDHGPIIYQKVVKINSNDTSYDVYKKIQCLEIDLLREHLEDIILNKYSAKPMVCEGNINYKKDFDDLCRIDLNKKATYGEVIDYLRAMTFEKYDNAYFLDEEGNKVYVSINIKKAN